MNSSKDTIKKKVDKKWDEICAEAAAQNKTPFIYLAEQSDGLRQMFIRWHKRDIEELEKIKSLRT